jgi:hypothetical protein
MKTSDLDKLILDQSSYGDIMKNSKWAYNQVSGQINQKLKNNWNSSLQTIYYL